MKVIGLAGRIGSGKTVAAKYLSERYRGKQKRFSKILMDILDILYLPNTRKNLQKLGYSLRKELGNDVIVNAFKKNLETEKNLVIIDGIRYPNEVEMLRSFKENILIYIYASSNIRYKRCKKRGDKDRPDMSYEEFVRADSAETEKYLDNIMEDADYVIDNSGSIDKFYETIDKIMKIFYK